MSVSKGYVNDSVWDFFRPRWYKSLRWNLSDGSRKVMGQRWCKEKDAEQESESDKE